MTAAADQQQTIQRWLDKSELTELVARLSSAVDRGDEAAIVACYAERSWDDHGGFAGSGSDFARYVCTPSPMRPADAVLHHLIGQSIFDVEGDEAWGETFYLFTMPAGDELRPGMGRYADYFQRIDGGWKLVYRRVLADWVGKIHAELSPSISGYVTSFRGPDDPKYDRARWYE